MKHLLTIPPTQDGFTIVELMVVMILSVIFSTMVMSFSIDFWGQSTNLTNSSMTLDARQNLGDSLRDRLNSATGLINQNSIADVNTAVSDPADPSGTHWLILHAIPSTITMPTGSTITPVMYFQSPATDSAKNILVNGTLTYQNEYILYLQGSTKSLMLRTLANPNAAGNTAKTTCPTQTSTCPADRTLSQDVSYVSTRYFSRSGNTLDWTSVKDPVTGENIGPDFPSVEVVELTIGLNRKAVIHGSGDSVSSTIIRVAFRNG